MGQPSIHSFTQPAFTELLLIADSEEQLLQDGMLLPPPLVGQQGWWAWPRTHQGQGPVARAAHPPGHGAGGRCEPSCSSPGRSVALSAGAPQLPGERVRRVRWDKKENAQFQGLLLKSESADLGWMSMPACSATKTCPTLCDPMVAPQAPVSMGFPRQEYRSSFPLPPPGDLPNPGVEPVSPSLAGSLFTTESAGKPSWVE